MEKRTALELVRSLRERLPNFKQVASRKDIAALDMLIAHYDDAQQVLDVIQSTPTEEEIPDASKESS